MIDERTQLIHEIRKIASGHQRKAVMEAAAVLLCNAIRQNNIKLADAEGELDHIVELLRARLREKDYDSNGERRITNILVPPLEELIAAELRH